MVLYEMAMSPNAKRARLGLAETGAPFERREVNLLAGEQKTAGYKAIHPLDRVPTLDDDGVIIWESGAILLYLGDKFPEARQGFARRRNLGLLRIPPFAPYL
jgi:glutathione S-transferase